MTVSTESLQQIAAGKPLEHLGNKRNLNNGEFILNNMSDKEIEIFTKTEESTLLKEMQHRMKNNLQLILSLINLQLADNIQEVNKEPLISLKQRVYSLSLINDCLNHPSDNNLTDLGWLLEQMTDNISKAYKTSNDIVVLKNFESVKVRNDAAIPVCLIVNELLTNAFKYAFPEQYINAERYNKIEVILRKSKGMHELIVEDNGASACDECNVKDLKSSGIKLVYSLIEQIGGTCVTDTTGGTSYKIIF
jgi:two-component system, sensor histidine kinase PdtaS